MPPPPRPSSRRVKRASRRTVPLNIRYAGMERGAVSRRVVPPAGVGPAGAGAAAARGERTRPGPGVRHRPHHRRDSSPPAGRLPGRRRPVGRDGRGRVDVAARARAGRGARAGRRRRAAVPPRVRRGLQRRDLPLDSRSRRALPLDHHGAEAGRTAGRAVRRRRQPRACCARARIGCATIRGSPGSTSTTGPSRGTTRTSSRRGAG